MTLQVLKSKTASKKSKRIGRGNGSGHGTYSCRGMKGQTARAGGKRRPGFEGGQTPFLRRMPKLKGFRNPNYVEYQAVNLSDLNVFSEKEEVNPEALYAKNLISKKNKPVKLLATGELEKALNITVHNASAKAVEAVAAKKGKLTLLEAKNETPAETKEAPAKTKD